VTTAVADTPAAKKRRPSSRQSSRDGGRGAPREVPVSAAAPEEEGSGEPPATDPSRAEAAEHASARMEPAALKRDARLVSLLRNAVEAAVGEDGWSSLGSVGQQIGNQASFDPRNYGYRKLIDLIEATGLFELDRRGTQVVLRDKRQARAARD
jgi:hypothetical protein